MGHAGDFAAFWTQYVAAATSVAAAAVDPFEVAGFFPLMAASGATVASMVVTVGVATATVAASYFVPLIAAAAGTTIVSIVQSAAPAAASFDSSEAAAAGMAGHRQSRREQSDWSQSESDRVEWQSALPGHGDGSTPSYKKFPPR